IMVLTTNKGLCSSTDTVNVLLYPGMSLKLDDTTQLCRGDSKLIGEPVSGGVGVRKSYVWSPADSLSLPNNVRTYAYPDSSTTYYISISDASNCTIRDSIHVEVISKPEVDFTLQDTCAGLRFSFNNETVYTGSAKDSVSWEVGQIEQSNFDNFSLTIDSAQDITVKLYSRNTAGCWDTTSKLLSVYPNPVPEIMLYNDCAFDTSTLKATSIISSGLTTEFWRIKNDTFVGNSVIIQTGSEPEIPVELYSVSDKGCVTTAYDTLELFAKPEISIDDLSSCFGDSIAMTLSTSVNLDTIQFIEWTASNLSSSNDPIFKPVFNDTGNYAINVMVRNRALCADTAEAIVRVNPLPVSTFTVDDVCEGEEFKLYDSSFISLGSINEILWDTGSGFKSGIDSIFSRKSIQGGYSFRQKVISSEGCVDSSEQFAALHYVPELDFTVSGNCVYSNFDFALNGVPQDSISTIQWRVDAQTYTSENFTHIFSTPGIYNVYQEAVTIQNCFVIDSGTVEVDPKPVASFIVKQKCNDQTIEFVNTGNTAIWNLGDGSTSVLDSFEYRYDTAGNYAVELQVVNSFGCRDTTSENVQVFNDPIPDFNIKNVCRFDSQWVSNRSQTFAEPITSAVFNMDNGETVSNLDSFKYAYQNAGIYQVELTITTLPGCTYSTTRNVEIYALPNAAFVLSPENADIFNSEVTVIDESGNADSVVYFLSDGTSYSTRDFKHAFQDSGTFYINQYVSNVYGCLDSAQRELYITFLYKLFIPNSFSPNDDGINDVFQPKGMGMKSYTMQIYNRWGQMVFESDQPNEAWDGKDAMMGYYVYQIKAYDFQGEPHYYNGVVYLLR
ncbi:gliding motility-associated C-terminal domain-containing protein, partial [bacterium]|nr:gliding motility-associated C-terminal domain-containing protein [bacterium]